MQRRDISRAWVSFPCALKHMSFDGRLLHGAPALQPLPPDALRVTFLANVSLLGLGSRFAVALRLPLLLLRFNCGALNVVVRCGLTITLCPCGRCPPPP